MPVDEERLLMLVLPLDYHLLLFIHVRTSGTVRGDVNHIKHGFTALGVRVKAMVKGKGLVRSRWVGQCRSITACVSGVRQTFGFCIT